MKRGLIIATLAVAFILGAAKYLTGTEHGKGSAHSGRVNKVTGSPVSTMLDINKAAAWYEANGEQERIPGSGNAGLFYPIGTLANAVYSAGIVWSSKYFNDGKTPTLRTNGQSYNNGTKPGAIVGIRTGAAEDPNAPDVRIWRIRRDYKTADVSQDAAYLNNVGLNNVSPDMIQAIRDQYDKDWREWPAKKGAPFYDANGDGIYDPKFDANGDPILYPAADEPGIAGADQVIWFVCNDIGVAEPWACPATGMEEQATIWGYARTDAIGNVIFKRFRLIYKGLASTPPDAHIDTMYMCQWSDIDLGDSGDDFAGCDTTLSLGYTYNGQPNDAVYSSFGLPPAASGYVFLQGPIVPAAPTDSAIFDLKKVYGRKNLPMTAFIYFAAGGRYSDPPFTYQGAIEWNQMLRGLPPQPAGPPDPPPLLDPLTGLPSHFWLSGDPVAHTGWIDGSIDPPGDRRQLLSSGPFNMALGDTQELVSSWVGGLGTNYLSSVAVLKFNAQSALFAYSTLFNLPKPPVAPSVKLTNLDGEVILDWDNDPAAVQATEGPVYPGGFAFEGYTVYQLPTPSADLSGAKRVATFDVKDGILVILQKQFDPNSGLILDLPVQFGSDGGIQRVIHINTDQFRNRPLVNGQPYYYAVTAYSYSPIQNSLGAPLVSLESPPQVIKAVPQAPLPGTRFSYAIGDTVNNVQLVDVIGKNDAIIYPVVTNPARDSGFTYYVIFDTSAGKLVWSLSNATPGHVRQLFTNNTDVTATVEYRVPEAGFSLYVGQPRSGMKSVTDESGNPIFGPPTHSGVPYVVLSSTGDVQGIAGLGSNCNKNYEIRFDGTGGVALKIQGGTAPIHVPFTAWDMGRTSSDTPIRVIPAVADSNGSKTWDLTPTGLLQGGTLYKVFDPIYITEYPSTGNDSSWLGVLANRIKVFQACQPKVPPDPNSALMNAFIADLSGAGTVPPAGTTFRFNKLLEVHPGDVKAFTPVKNDVEDVTVARADVTQIKVFPNPYYGVNTSETDTEHRFVTFSHLPDRAVIRIFNLAGVLVRTLYHPDQNPKGPGQFMDWDLHNTNGLPVASGIYIAFIQMTDAAGRDLGTKTLKFAIIQEQQFLRYY